MLVHKIIQEISTWSDTTIRCMSVFELHDKDTISL